MNWKHRHRSFYTRDFGLPEDPELVQGKVALLVVDLQQVYLETPDPDELDAEGRARLEDWEPFHRRVRELVVPNVARLLARFRAADLDVAFARVGSARADGRDRPRARRTPEHSLMLADDPEAQIPEAVAPGPGEIVVTKTGDSALSGTGLGLALKRIGITDVVVAGLLTDQCVSSTVRALADADFSVIVVEDACAAGTESIHAAELATLNLLYCSVMTTEEVVAFLPA